MAMFPVFIAGCVAGVIGSYVYFSCIKTIPSNTKFKLQEDTIQNMQNDMRAMELVNEELRKQVDELKARPRPGRKPKTPEK